MNHTNQTKILITGVAGLVGKNLVADLYAQGHRNIVGIDKNERKLKNLQRLYPALKFHCIDLSQKNSSLAQVCENVDTLFILHAQIGGCQNKVFEKHTILSTINLLSSLQEPRPSFVLFLSSSAIFSKIPTPYSEAKKRQEELVLKAFPRACVLRPTILMGADDDKHFSFLFRLGSLFHFLPIPGDGAYVRQPLFVGDLCKAIVICFKEKRQAIYDLTGPQAIPFIELLKLIFLQNRLRVCLLPVPLRLFGFIFHIWSFLFPGFIFTHTQLQTLILNETFLGVDWKNTFGFSQISLKVFAEKCFKREI